MDNTTIVYNAIQRTYRSAVVDVIRQRMTQEFDRDAVDQLKSLFGKKDESTGKTYWEQIEDAANERRSGGTGELSTPIRDPFEMCGVEHFFMVFEKFFDVLVPSHADRPKREKNQLKQTLTTWMKQIKSIRDPISHPVTDDISFADATMVLYNARKVLDICGKSEATAQILRLNATLLGGFTNAPEAVLTCLPPPDEVVMDFVGRHAELRDLRDWLYSGKSRRWALSGDGGKGKSAIAFAFAKSLAPTTDHNLDAILWISAKRRRFIEGATALVDRPDFTDKASALSAILRCFGATYSADSAEHDVLGLLTEYPALLVVDDIDTVEGDSEDAIQFLVMTVPEVTKTRVLVTSRRKLFGMANLTTQVQGLSNGDLEEFLKSRCDLMGIAAGPVLAAKEALLHATDASPLFVEDLLRLSQAGLQIEKAIGIWAEKRGDEARKYAIQREYDQLSDDSKQVLLALSLQGPCGFEDICKGLDWPSERLVDAMDELRKMFLMPHQSAGSLLALNRNTQLLVLKVFGKSEAYRRTQRLMRAAAGVLRPQRREEQVVSAQLARSRLLVRQGKCDEAENNLQALASKYPGRADVLSHLGWTQKNTGDRASARMNYRRAHDLGCRERDMYWHWSDLEAIEEEWKASEEAASLGVAKFGNEQGLLFRQGYALHRQGRELIFDGEMDQGQRLCKKAAAILEKAKEQKNGEDRNFSLRFQIYRAIAINLELIEDWSGVIRHFAEWSRECPHDDNCGMEYERMRRKYPEHLAAK